MAYFKNFPLLAVFIGLGLGCLLSNSSRSFFTASLWGFTLLAFLIVNAEVLGWSHLIFPDANLDIWNRIFQSSSPQVLMISITNLVPIFVLLLACAFSFVGLGQLIGQKLKEGLPLHMYTIDILGSLAGVLLFGLLSYLHTAPCLWLTGGSILLVILAKLSRNLTRPFLYPIVLLFLMTPLVFLHDHSEGIVTRWSPYYKISVFPLREDPRARSYWLEVNHDVHQRMLDLSSVPKNPPNPEEWEQWKRQYDFPYELQNIQEPLGSVLIGGAGTGNDAAAATRHGATNITAVEIDPEILSLGKEMHPEHPYQNKNVHLVNTDLRSFLRRTKDHFDIIIFSILDSHTALSSLSSIRLDNYIYTVEGIRNGWKLLSPQGIMLVSFWDVDRVWLGERIYRDIELATGTPPVCTRIGGAVFFIFGPHVKHEEVTKKLQALQLPLLDSYYKRSTIRPATDDWPFLYSNPSGQPFVYYLSLCLIVILGGLTTAWVMRRQTSSEILPLDWPMLFLGGGFLLVETKAMAELSLLFGSTWIVNLFVFAGIFVMILLSNYVVFRSNKNFTNLAFLLLACSLIGWFLFPRSILNELSFTSRAFLGTFLVVIPIFFAGIVFANEFSRRKNPSVAFGSNLIGAVVGGAMEATSLSWGIRALTLVALLFYTSAWLISAKLAPSKKL